MIKIAITEDLPIILEGIKLLLSQVSDFEVVAEFNNGKDLVDNIHASEADIYLTDINMPVMDGITATREILSMYPEKKVIALSMYSDSVYYFQMLNSGAKGFVLKQSTVSELESAVRDVFNGGNFFSKILLQSIILKITSGINNSIHLNHCGNLLPEISPRERVLLGYLCQGLSNRELSEKLFVSVKTVEGYKTRLMEKTETRNTAGLIIWAIRNKIIDL